ncbi:MAG: hypothetical protein RI957_768 [Verrucomicrobiota bacterium]|jgi:hypothetical protein
MKIRYLVIGAFVLIGSAWLTKVLVRRSTPPPSALAPIQHTARPSDSPQDSIVPKSPPTAAEAKSQQDDTQSTKILLEKIHDASVTYDPKQLPYIAEFLLHENPEVRKASLDGMIVLGDSAAAPLLRKAALSAPSPQEAVALEEAAKYMELPSASLIKRRKK